MNNMKVLAVFALFLIIGVTGTAHAQLAIGPVDPANGFPKFIADNAGTRLGLCLDDPLNCDPGPGVNAFTKQIGFTDAAYYAAVARVRSSTGITGSVEFSVMAEFAGEPKADGGQVVRNKKVIEFSGLPVAGVYRVLHPYGEDTFNVALDLKSGKGSIASTTQTVGTPANGFKRAGLGPVTFFLNQANAPAGFIGTDLQEPVSGSPIRNFVQLIGPRGAILGGGAAPNVLRQNLFDMEGKMFR